MPSNLANDSGPFVSVVDLIGGRQAKETFEKEAEPVSTKFNDMETLSICCFC